MLTVEISLPEVEELQKLVADGQEKGFLSYDEIATGLEEVELTKEQVEDFYTYLSDHGVELVGGADGADVSLMLAAPGWFAKGGAEGLLCAGGPGGLGIALKSEDGSPRPLRPALAVFLPRFGVDLPELAAPAILDSQGERVGESVAVRS